MAFIRSEDLLTREQAKSRFNITDAKFDELLASGNLPEPKWTPDEIDAARRKLAGEPEHRVVKI